MLNTSRGEADRGCRYFEGVNRCIAPYVEKLLAIQEKINHPSGEARKMIMTQSTCSAYIFKNHTDILGIEV